MKQNETIHHTDHNAILRSQSLFFFSIIMYGIIQLVFLKQELDLFIKCKIF